MISSKKNASLSLKKNTCPEAHSQCLARVFCVCVFFLLYNNCFLFHCIYFILISLSFRHIRVNLWFLQWEDPLFPFDQLGNVNIWGSQWKYQISKFINFIYLKWYTEYVDLDLLYVFTIHIMLRKLTYIFYKHLWSVSSCVTYHISYNLRILSAFQSM